MSSLYWLRQPTWFIDPIAGNDRNTGLDSGHAIKTFAELARRWGRIGTCKFDQATTVTVTSSPPVGDIFDSIIAFGESGSLKIVGTPTIVASSSFTNVGNINRATPLMQTVTDTAVLGGSWTPYVGTHMIRNTTAGPRLGATAWVAFDLGSQTCRTTRFTKPLLTTSVPTFTAMAPQIGDTYQLLLPTQISIGVVQVLAANNSVSTKQLIMTDIFGHTVTDSSLFTAGGMAGFRFGNCRFDAFRLTGGAGNAQGCMFSGSVVAQGCYIGAGAQFLAFSGGAITPVQFLPGSTGSLDLDFLFQSSTTPVIFKGAVINAGLVVVFDGGGPWLDGGTYNSDPGLDGGLDLLWGGNLTSNALTVRGGTFAYTTKPTLNAGLGVPREVRLGGTPGFTPNGSDITWALVPASDLGSGAFIAERDS